jgi:hypothetical protein
VLARVPSSETVIESNSSTARAACFASDNPEVSSHSDSPRLSKSSAISGHSGFSSGSPPDSSTARVRNCASDGSRRCTDASDASFTPWRQ